LSLSFITYLHRSCLLLFFFTAPPPTDIYTLSLHDALPIYSGKVPAAKKESHDHGGAGDHGGVFAEEKKRELHRRIRRHDRRLRRSEEHTSELQSLAYLVCRLLLEKKKKKKKKKHIKTK